MHSSTFVADLLINPFLPLHEASAAPKLGLGTLIAAGMFMNLLCICLLQNPYPARERRPFGAGGLNETERRALRETVDDVCVLTILC